MGNAKKSGFKKNSFQIITHDRIRFIICRMLLHRLLLISSQRQEYRSTEHQFGFDNIKMQIIKHSQHISDCEAYVMAEIVRNASRITVLCIFYSYYIFLVVTIHVFNICVKGSFII